MARRLFSTQIVDSDAFLDMPSSVQNLYFHLGMRADDDGFVGNPKKIARMCGANEDEIKILIGKRFVLAFKSGVVVIKHWLIHNSIRKDRYTETSYKEEKATLSLKENRSYTEKDKAKLLDWQPDGNQTATNGCPKLSKGKLSKVKLSKDNIVADPCDTWNSQEYINKLLEDKQRHIHLIGLYWQFKGIEQPTKEAAQAALKRDLRAAKNLVGYPDEKIKKVMMWLNKEADFKWTAESILKYIDEPKLQNYLNTK